MLATSEAGVNILYNNKPIDTLPTNYTNYSLSIYNVEGCNWMPVLGSSLLGVRACEDGSVRFYASYGDPLKREDILFEMLKAIIHDNPGRDVIVTPLPVECNESSPGMVQVWVQVQGANFEVSH